jgi:hypothetical protein
MLMACTCHSKRGKSDQGNLVLREVAPVTDQPAVLSNVTPY